MKFSLHWLQQWVSIPLQGEALQDKLALCGFEVESLVDMATVSGPLVVGQIVDILSTDQDTMVYQVDVGEQLTLSCPQSLPRLTQVVVALPGATLAGGNRVTGSAILCRQKDVGLWDSDEVVQLSGQTVGTPIDEGFFKGDQQLDVDMTANRGDCLSSHGFARELAAIFQQPVAPLTKETVAPTLDDRYPLQQEVPTASPLFCTRVIRHLSTTASTPLWMQARLHRAGLKVIHPIVDITNYVMLELGQPLHAYDRKALQGPLRVRWAKDAELLTLLDERQVSLQANTLVIADDEKVLGMAGVMGGLQSAVTAGVTDIVLEAAFFPPEVVAGQARQYGLATESAYRFERGVDFQLPQVAMERATALLVDILGGKVGPMSIFESTAHLPERDNLTLDIGETNRLLGALIPLERQQAILTDLGFTATPTSDSTLAVTVPSHRFDCTIQEDLMEEVGRIHGYDNIIPQRAAMAPIMAPTNIRGQRLRLFTDTLVTQGFHECITYSFVAPQWQQQLFPDATVPTLVNPISDKLSQMRVSLWPGLLMALAHNQHRQQSRVWLFEQGVCFSESTEHQPLHLAGLMQGSAFPEQWGQPARDCDFFDMKQVVENLLASIAAQQSIDYRAAPHSCLHPGQSAAIFQEGRPLGWLGTLHPKHQTALGLTGPIVLFELALDMLLPPEAMIYRPLSKFPALRRDLSFYVAEAVSAKDIVSEVKKISCDFLQDVSIFDIYINPKQPHQKSVALGLILQDVSRTLNDEEINSVMTEVVERLQQSFNIV